MNNTKYFLMNAVWRVYYYKVGDLVDESTFSGMTVTFNDNDVISIKSQVDQSLLIAGKWTITDTNLNTSNYLI